MKNQSSITPKEYSKLLLFAVLILLPFLIIAFAILTIIDILNQEIELNVTY
jgi:hypothetical protein